ncbi:MAG: UDP-4-amino-4,6-dideoxy-N-acetyl-beta-L-altrosamine transaminase [Proteobacteria bacterium]|nr:UDP-4-amino-4,6-dideoxy-N-acetyl-beta-L-altrosamine transaminase [Pseudomonadota bacterium]
MSTARFLPYGRHSIDDADVAAVTEVLRGDWLTTGPKVKAFEEAFAAAVGARYAVACSSGTAALHLTALAADIGVGDAAVVPTLTFLATANCNRYVGAEVVFSDVDPDTGLMEAEHLEAALARAGDRRILAVYPVHLNGQCAELNAIRELAEKHGLMVIEDACHALGASYRPDDAGEAKIGAGAFADMAIFSFHPVKTIAMGEGGAVTTNDEVLYRRLMRMRNHGMTRDAEAFTSADLAFDAEGAANPWYYEMAEPGFNYRASDIHCALGLSQLAKLEAFVARRRVLAERYDRLLAALAPLVQPIARTPGCTPAWHLYVVHVDFAAAGVSRATLMRQLRDAGIGTQVHYLPLHMQPYYRRRYGPQELPGAQTYYDRCLTLPLYPAMADSDVDRVAEALGQCLKTRPGP